MTATPTDSIVHARDIHKSFGTLHILKGVSLEVSAREIVAIKGASGAGKTTLLQILGTLDTADAGRVLIAGQDVLAMNDRNRSAFRNQNIGFIFQFHQLLPEFTAQENVALPHLIGGASKQQAMRRAAALLERVGLADRLSHKPNALSGGEKQRVAVARALVNEPLLILADEPSGALDTERKEELHEIFLTLRRELGQTFVIVTHDDALARIADRVITLKDGQVVHTQVQPL